jgi:hypothetical protein
VNTAFIGKYNSNSQSWLWVKKIALLLPAGSYNFSIVHDICVDNSGNLYLTGFYAGSISFDGIILNSTKQGNLSTADMFVAKYNSSGTVQWAKSFGSKIGMDSGNAIKLDGSGNIYAAGYLTNKIVKCEGANYEQWDIFLLKLNNGGTSLWQKRYASTTGCNGNNSATDLVIDNAGNPYISGNFVGIVSFGTGAGMSITALGFEDAFGAKISSAGNTLWVRSIGSTDHDYGKSVHVDAAGNAYLGGKLNLTSFVTKYNPSGSAQWTINPFTITPVESINAYGTDLLVNDYKSGLKRLSSADGTLINYDSIAGYNITGRTNLKDVENAGNGFAFCVNVQCGSTTIGNQIFTASCANACGQCSNYGDIGIVRFTNNPPALVEFPEVISPDDALLQEVTVYPNPSAQDFTLSYPSLKEEWIQLRLFDIHGVMQFKARMLSNQPYHFGHDLAPGVYVAELIVGKERMVVKVVKE